MTPFQDEINSTEALFREYQETRSPETRNEIVERHLQLAEVLARRYAGRGVDFEDLFQVSAYGLVLAVERYEPVKGIQFVSFATPTIIGEIKKYFRDTTWSLKVPRRLKEISARIMESKEILRENLQRIPTVQELSAHIGVTEEDIIEALESGRAYAAYSLDQDQDDFDEGENASVAFEKFLGDEEAGYRQLETSGIFENVMEDLSPTEKDIIRKRFLHEVTQREVAEALGISQMSVSRIEKAMKEKFRLEYNR